MQFAITFGQKYRREPHPTLGLRPELVDGWLTVDAKDEMGAREKIAALIDNVYAFLYGPGHDLSCYHPLGSLGSLEDAVAQAQKPAWLVGLPVWVDYEGRVTVDMTEMGSALAETNAPYSMIDKLDDTYLGGGRAAVVVAFRNDTATLPRCPHCGAPVYEYRTSTPDGDSESHAHCLNRQCSYVY